MPKIYKIFFTVFILAIQSNTFGINKINLHRIIALDAGISAILSPSSTGCYNATQSVVVTIQNFGTSAISNIPVSVIMSGPVNQTISSTYLSAIPVGSSVNFYVGMVNMSFGGIYTFSASSSLAGDGNSNNDISITTRTVTPMVNIVGPPAICNGSVATLIAGGAATYTWDSGSNSTSISISPSVTTTYSVIGTNTAGCTAIAFLTVSVQNPSISATGALACGNPASGTLSASAFSPATISWFSSPTSTIVLGTGNNFSLSSGTTITCYAEANSTNSGSLFTTLSGGNSAFGNMFDLTAINSLTLTGLQWHFNSMTPSNIEVWYRAGSFVGFENSNAGWTLAYSGTVTPLGTGFLTNIPGSFTINIPAGQTYGIYVSSNGSGVNYTNGTGLGNLFTSNTDLQLFEGKGGNYFAVNSSPRIFNGQLLYSKLCCTSARAPATFSVISGVTVTAAVSQTAVCEGNSATLTANGASNYTWSPTTGIAPGPNSTVIIASPTANTSYTVIGSIPGCTAIGTATAHLTMIQGPTLTISPSQTVIAGSIITLTTGGAFTYSWSPGGSNNTNILVNPSVTTVYTVTGTNSYSCSSTITTTVTIGSVGFNNNGAMSDNDVLLYPNPVNSVLNLEFIGEGIQAAAARKTGITIKISVTNILGKEIISPADPGLKLQILNSRGRMDVGDLPEGIYFINIKVNDRTVSKKFMIAR